MKLETTLDGGKEIEARAIGDLAQSSIFNGREINCSYENNVLILTGRVETFYEKQMAQETVRRGEVRIDNQIKVNTHDRDIDLEIEQEQRVAGNPYDGVRVCRREVDSYE
ncbi:hypothetical protein CMI42_06220 [Candidatus Pacearchaeota archaeon]|nr:hypothetical protein [Candidatus Pacearchaeota archaeon]